MTAPLLMPGPPQAAFDAASGALIRANAAFTAEAREVSRLADLGLGNGIRNDRGVFSTPRGRHYALRTHDEGGLVLCQLIDVTGEVLRLRRAFGDRVELAHTARRLAVTEMTSVLAHEMGQPLGSIGNLVGGLKTRAEKGALSSEEMHDALSRAAAHVHYAGGILQRLRDYVAERRPETAAVDLTALIRRSLDLLGSEIEEQGIILSTSFSPDIPPARGDAVMLQQVVVNLARNAIEAMAGVPPGSRELDVDCKTEQAGEIQVTIADNGPGVTPRDADRLFRPLSSSKPGGAGIGLSVCRTIIELHRGRLWYTTGSQGGAAFHFALPVADGGEDA
jgi:two-component system sensor kinase FixL